MNTQEFLAKWLSIGTQHVRVNSVNSGKFNLGSAAYDFLFLTGMPSEFQDLNFDYLKEEKLETVNQKWALKNSEYDKYVAIGFNGSGDPIAINLDSQELVYLNHDNYFEEVFINSDMKRFAFSVLRIQNFAEQLQKLNLTSLFATEFSDDQFNQLIEDLKVTDGKIFEARESHWNYTLDCYKSERDNERRVKANDS